MPRLLKFTALLLATLWLPAALHCQLEAAEIHFLTHDHDYPGVHHHADHSDSAGDEHHPFKDTSVTHGKSAVKLLPPTHCQTFIVVALLTATPDNLTSHLSPERHAPPLEIKVAWQFIARAAPPARAPSLHS